MKNDTIRGTSLVILSTIAFGIMPMLSQLSFKEGMNVSSILFFRFFIAAIIIWSYIFIKKVPYKTTKDHLLYLIALGIVGYVGCSTTIYMAYTYISGSLATILLFTHPAMITLYEIFVQKSEKDLRKMGALFCATIGIILVVWNHDLHLNRMGIILSLLSALFYSFYALGLAEIRTQKMNSISISGYILLFGTLAYSIEGLFNGDIASPATLNGWGYILLLSIFSTVFATVTFCHGVKLIGPSSAVIISTFEPVVASIGGFFIIGDVLTIPIIIGGLLILSAIFILQTPIYKKRTS